MSSNLSGLIVKDKTLLNTQAKSHNKFVNRLWGQSSFGVGSALRPID